RIGGGECVRAAGGRDRRFPFVGGADIGEGERGEALRHLEDAREILRAFHVTLQPVKVVGGARQHLLSATDCRARPQGHVVSGPHPHRSCVPPHRSKTQVSFVPPPWLELTTSDPFFSATRVRPPGTMRMRSRPVSTNGRRSTWRGATPSSTQVGQVDNASVGWAMKFFGLDLSLARNAATVAMSAIGPINMP